nr:glycerophosphodiester phosphodiesterase family protein [Pseudofrankia sp. DC12]
MAPPTFLDHPGPIAFAHRGGAGPWPENSWPAFTHAIALGYRYLETDVRVTRDGTAMILHDPTLDRVSDHTGRLANLTAAEAGRVRLHPPSSRPGATEPPPATVTTATTNGSNSTGNATAAASDAPTDQAQPSSAGGEPIPRLDDLLDRWPDARFNLDVKEAAALEPTIAALLRVNALGRVCVTSFDDGVAREARRLAGPNLCLGAGMSAIAVARLWSFLPSWLAVGRSNGGRSSDGSNGRGPADGREPRERSPSEELQDVSVPRSAEPSGSARPDGSGADRQGARRPRGLVGRDVVQVPVSFRSVQVCDARFVRYLKTIGLPVHVWTVNDEAAMEALLDLGVDGLITDRPEVLRTVLRRRALWPAT